MKFGWTLELTRFDSNTGIALKLIEMGADVNRKVNNCAPLLTVLHMASFAGNEHGAACCFEALLPISDLTVKVKQKIKLSWFHMLLIP